MDRIALERRLARAEGHVTLGERRVARQYEIVAALARGRHDTASARQVLAIFRKTLEAFCLHRDMLQREWAHGSWKRE